ncbi:MAG TPA: hypothetical protein DHW34_03675 [Actinobacteria bacterium]|nr:hypothetical protein [Actinomycetota bacterium]
MPRIRARAVVVSVLLGASLAWVVPGSANAAAPTPGPSGDASSQLTPPSFGSLTGTPSSPVSAGVLRVGSRGRAVLVLERRLHMARADRIFDRATARRVRSVQGWAKIARTGVVDSRTSRAISAWNRAKRVAATRAARQGTIRRNAVIRMAQRFSGRPYAFGAAGPSSFDCSGFTRFIFSRALGISLPHQSGGQASVSRRIRPSQARPGDLVFFTSGGRVYHVGIYAGHGRLYHSPEPGKRTGLDPIFARSHFFGRVIG